jgi:hypothetical protein
MNLRSMTLCGVALAALVAAGGANAADLALKRVLLSTGGVGLFEYEAEVEGDATVELKVRLDQVDDVLKSLVVFDDHGGVGGLDLASAEPLSAIFRSLPFTQEDLASGPQILTALQGAEIEASGPRAVSGRVVAVSEEVETKSDGGALPPRHRVTVMNDKGLEQFVLEEAQSVRFVDPALRDAIAKALKAVASNHERDSRVLRLSSKGTDKRKLRVAYLAAAPVWKASYRLVLDPAPEAKQATLQGWATLENLSGQDWSHVDLTLVSGRPVAYKQALYRAYMLDRPSAPLDVGEGLTPEVDRGDVAYNRDQPRLKAARMQTDALAKQFAGAANAAQAPMAAPMLAESSPTALSAAVETIAAQDSMTQVAFHIPFAVSLAAGRTLSLPIVDALEPTQRVDIYQPLTDRRHPLMAAEITNDGKAALPPGIVTIYERGADGASYVGDSLLSATPGGDKRLLSFALDQKTTIDTSYSDGSSFVRARLAKGVLTVEELNRRRTVFHVKASEPRRLIVNVPQLYAGARLSEPAGVQATEANGAFRIAFDVKAGDGQSFAATVEHTQTRAIALASSAQTLLDAYVRNGEIDADTRTKLAKLGELRAAQVEAERALSQVQYRIDATVADQTRLKELLGAAVAGSDLQKRYLGKLDADETQLEALNAEHAQRAEAAEAARKAVDAYVAEM